MDMVRSFTRHLYLPLNKLVITQATDERMLSLMRPRLPALLTILFLLLLSACSSQPQQPTSSSAIKSNTALINWGSPKGIRRLEQSQYKIDFFTLANQFESQTNKIFCGPTTAAIVLNALRIRKGQHTLPQDTSLLTKSDKIYLPKNNWSPFYARYTQNTVLLKGNKSRQSVLGKPSKLTNGASTQDFGFQIRQLAELLNSHDLSISLHIANASMDNETIKNSIIHNLKTAGDYVIINYQRNLLGQKGGGHISPLGAYHQPSDSFLIMDVTPNKADWVWVPSGLMINAMRSFDTHENRGYLLVSDTQ